MFTLYNVVSADGFIARKDGSEDFIPDNLWQGFLDLCEEYGTVVLSRKAYEAIQTYEQGHVDSFEALPIKRLVVSRNERYEVRGGYTLVRSPEEVAMLTPDALVSSGPTLNNYLLRNHLVGKIILREVPLSIGEGIEPFDPDLVRGIEIVRITEHE